MKKRWMNATALGAAVFGLAGLTLSRLGPAEPGDKTQPKGPAHPARAALAAHWFDRIDTNHDGQLSQAELENGAQQLFGRLDTNNDGELTRDEAESGAAAIRKEELGARFQELDTNEDGRLTPGEAKIPARFFDRLDSDHDHALTLAEFLSHPDFGAQRRAAEFNRVDLDHDGKITRSEAEQAAKQRFQRLDADHDGNVTREEFAQQLAAGRNPRK